MFSRGASFDIILTFPITAALTGFFVFERSRVGREEETPGEGGTQIGSAQRCLYARVAKDASEDPERFFARCFLPRVDFELIEMAEENWAWGQEIILARRNNRWGKSPEACFQYNTPCKFLGICSNHDSPESGNWELKQYAHSELPVIDGVEGKNVLTNSSLATFRAVRVPSGHERPDASMLTPVRASVA